MHAHIAHISLGLSMGVVFYDYGCVEKVRHILDMTQDNGFSDA